MQWLIAGTYKIFGNHIVLTGIWMFIFSLFAVAGSKITSLKYLSLVLILAAPVFCYARMQGRWDPDSPGFNKDLLTYTRELRDAVPGDELCVVGNDQSRRIFFYYIDKKGWAFHGDNLVPQDLNDMIERGAGFLYSDSRFIDEDPAIQEYLDHQVCQYGTIKVYRLKENEASVSK